MKYVYFVDNFWRVIASSPHEARMIIGQYHDLPASWYQDLPVEFKGMESRIPLVGNEIRREFSKASLNE